MPTLITAANLADIQCCVLNMADDVMRDSKRGCLTRKCLQDAFIRDYQANLIRTYIPVGTIITEGFTSEATLDLNSFSAFGVLIGFVEVAGNIIAVLPETTYADLDALITALVLAINTGPSPYSAADNGDGTITIFAPGPGAQANGFAITIQINPTFIETAEPIIPEESEDGFFLSNMITVNDTTSAFYGYTFISGSIDATGASVVKVYFNHVLAYNIPITGVRSMGALAYDSVKQRIYTAGGNGTLIFGYIDNTFSWTNLGHLGSGGLSAYYGVFNPSDGAKYFTANAIGIFKLDTLDVISQFPGLDTSLGTTTRPVVDPANGRIWCVSNTDIRIYSTAGALITTINTGGNEAEWIEYYPGDGTPNSDRVFALFRAPLNLIRSYNMDGTVDQATFYSTTVGTFGYVHYSAIYNVIFLFADVTNHVYVLTIAGVLKQDIGAHNAGAQPQFTDNNQTGEVIGGHVNQVILPYDLSELYYYRLGNDGEEEFDDALEGGTDDVIQTAEDNCLSETDVNNAVQYLLRDCGCGGCGSGASNGSGSVLPPSGATYVIYYGNSDDDALDNTGIEALTASSQLTYASTYSFAATSPSEWKYISFPTSLGTPTRFYDPSTNFDVAMDSSYTVTINFISYTVYRSFFELGGAISIAVT